MQEKKKAQYFEEALSDFTHDVASGRAIRHLVDLGYTTDQIMGQLDYPTPRTRVEQTVYRYMKEKGILTTELPKVQGETKTKILKKRASREVYRYIWTKIDENGEMNSYVSCPFGMIYRDREQRMQQILAPLTSREKAYILGIPWEMQVVYHRLTRRMTEIAVQLALYSDAEFRFYFLQSNEIVTCVD